MGPPSYMRSVVDRNVVIRYIPVLSSVACLSLQYFFHVSHKRDDFHEKNLNTKFWF